MAEGNAPTLVAFLRGESGLPDLPKYSEKLEEAQEGLEETLTGLAHAAEAPYDPMTGQPFTWLPDKVKIISPRDSFCPKHKNTQKALPEHLSLNKNLWRRVKEIIESRNDKRRQAERESEAENRTQRETDAGNREEQETAIEDRTVSEQDPGKPGRAGRRQQVPGRACNRSQCRLATGWTAAVSP